MSWLSRLASRLRLAYRLRRSALVGEVQDHILVEPAQLDDREFGASRSMRIVQEIKVSAKKGPPADVGPIVKQKYFPNEDDFVFNVVFSCGEPGFFDRGVYGDPRSIWFNVFFGYYQIDVPRPGWARPFGYESDSTNAPVALGDVVRIGKADWNYFSNYVYGVPAEAIAPYDAWDLNSVKVTQRGRVRIGESYWDDVELDGVEVVSAYVAPGEKHRLVNHDPVFSPAMRFIFGLPCPCPGHTTSFVPTRMLARLFMAPTKSAPDADIPGPSYQTLIFGGTVRSDHPDKAARDRFLSCQISALHKVIARSYPRAGFAAP